MKRRDPQTPEEWQDAVNGAEFFLSIDSCQQYGLIDGGPEVNADRCRDILERGRAQGVTPAPFEDLLRMFVVPA